MSNKKIKNTFYKVGCVPFTMKYLNNPCVRHELNEIQSKVKI